MEFLILLLIVLMALLAIYICGGYVINMFFSDDYYDRSEEMTRPHIEAMQSHIEFCRNEYESMRKNRQ